MDKTKSLTINHIDALKTYAKAAVSSAFFTESRNREEAIAQAFVRIQYGHEFGMSPMASLSQIHVVKGKPCLSAGAIASQIKKSQRYNFRVTEHSDKLCRIDFFENDEMCGTSIFTMDDAKRAGLLGSSNWAKYPKAMLFARAITQGARWNCPDVFHGGVYTPDELDPKADAGIVDAEFQTIDAEKPQLTLETGPPKVDPEIIER